jgi:phosphinothricin acetyltransferase
MPCEIRLASEADAADCLAIYRPFVLETAVSFETEAPSPAGYAARIRETLRHTPWLVCHRDGVPAGFAYAVRHRSRLAYQWSVETTVYVGKAFRGEGVGGALYRSLVGCLVAQGFVNAYAVITLPNPASVALHERAGFVPLTVYREVGYKLGRWHDVGWWHLRLQPPPLPAAPPRPLAEVAPAMGWALPG